MDDTEKIPQCMARLPAQFLHGADINNTIVQMIDESRHVLHQKYFVHVNAVSRQRTSRRRCVPSNEFQKLVLRRLQRQSAFTYLLRQPRLKFQPDILSVYLQQIITQSSWTS